MTIMGKWWEIDDSGELTPKGKETRLGYVYFVEAVGSGYVKIGFATSVDKRLSALQTSNPHELRPLHSIRANYSLESALQVHFAEHWVRGEWYRLDPIREWIASGSPVVSASVARRVVHASMYRAIFSDLTRYLSDYFDQHGVTPKKVPMVPSEHSGEMVYKHRAKVVHHPMRFGDLADEYLMGRGIDHRTVRTWNDLLLDEEMEGDWKLYHSKRARYLVVSGQECYDLSIRDQEPVKLVPWEDHWTERMLASRLEGLRVDDLTTLERHQWFLAATREGMPLSKWVRSLVTRHLDSVGWPEEDLSV